MNVQDMSKFCMTESGQFLLGTDIIAVQFDYTRFVALVRRAVAEYARYRPVEKKYTINIIGLNYTFTAGTPNGIPLWISNVVPVAGVNNPLGSTFLQSGHDQLSPHQFLWEYRLPVLYPSEPGLVEVTAAYKHPESVVSGGTGSIATDYVDLSFDDTQFLDLLLARFLIAVGKSRRSFTLNELPLVSDASEIVSDGKELLDSTLEALKENSSWWLSV